MSFSDKVVLITGAGSGIGAASAVAFAKEGAKVVMVDKDDARLNDVVEKCKTHQKPIPIIGDVTLKNDVKRIIETTVNICKSLDVLVNCAGIFDPSNIFNENLMELYDDMMNVNLRGIVQLTQMAVPHLIKSKGSIINISSCVVSASNSRGRNFLCYGISKAGLNYFSLDLANELAPHGVRVNIISPGPVRTNIARHLMRDDYWEEMKLNTALGRVSEPEEIADIVLFISKSKGIHGSNYECSNGYI